MSDKKLRKALIKLASEKPDLRKDLLPLLKEGKQEKEADYMVPRADVQKLTKLVREAEALADRISGSIGEEQRSFWYWHDIFVALSNVNEAISSGRPLSS